MSSEEYTALSDRLDRIERLALLTAKPVLNVREAAAFTGFSVKHLYRLTSTRQIPHFKKNAKLLFKKTELEDWLTTCKVLTEEEIERQALAYTTKM